MLGELEAVAADWLRGLAGRRHRPDPPIGKPCANCGAILQGPFCHACGQNSDDHKRSILHLVVEAFEGLFHFDGRLWRTIPALFFRPGLLARDYVEGRTARHVPPFRTFLVALLLLIFAAEHAVHELRLLQDEQNRAKAARLATPQGRAAEAARIRASAVKEHAIDLAEIARDHATELKEAETDKARAAVERGFARHTINVERAYAMNLARADSIARGDPQAAQDAAVKAAGDRYPRPPHRTGPASRNGFNDWFNPAIKKAVANQDYYLMIVFGWAHRMAVLLLPIVGLTLAMVYGRRKDLFLYDHLLVAMNVLSFNFLSNAFGLILPIGLWSWWFGFLWLWTPVNLFQTLRGAYGSTILGAALKTLVVWSISAVAFGAMMVGLLVYSLSQL